MAAPRTSLEGDALQGVLIDLILPFLSAEDLGRLTCVSLSFMCTLQASPVSLWTRAAQAFLPQKLHLPCTRTHFLSTEVPLRQSALELRTGILAHQGMASLAYSCLRMDSGSLLWLIKQVAGVLCCTTLQHSSRSTCVRSGSRGPSAICGAETAHACYLHRCKQLRGHCWLLRYLLVE